MVCVYGQDSHVPSPDPHPIQAPSLLCCLPDSMKCKGAPFPAAGQSPFHSHLLMASVSSALTAALFCHNQLFVCCFRLGIYTQLGTVSPFPQHYCVLKKKNLSLFNQPPSFTVVEANSRSTSTSSNPQMYPQGKRGWVGALVPIQLITIASVLLF